MGLIIIEGNKSEIEQSYTSNPIRLDRNYDYEIALTQCTLWYSWHNISDKFKNNTFEFRKNKDEPWLNVVIPNGMYNEECFNYFLSHYFNASRENCPITVSSNPATMRFVILLKDNYEFKFNSDLSIILGFENDVKLSDKINEGTKVPNITRNVDKIQVHCSLVDSSIVNGARSDVIWTFAPNTEPGCLIVEIPKERQYLLINRKEFINSLKMTITDQLGRLIDFNGENVGYVLDLKKV